MDTHHDGDHVGRVLFFVTSGIILILVFAGGFLVGHREYRMQTQFVTLEQATLSHTDAAQRVDFSLFWKAWDLLKEKHVEHDTIDAKKLVYGAIQGMFVATGDPYTIFLDPEDKEVFNEILEGSFEGIGAEIGLRDNLLTIIAPLDDSPAAQAMLRAGDKIIAIDGDNTVDMSVDDAVKRIRGDKNTDVVLTIYREGEDDTRDITVTRAEIKLDSVRSEVLDNNVTYIRVSQFGATTAREFASELGAAEKRGARGIIIDLRNNPGGFLDAGVEMVAHFVPANSVAVIEESASGVQLPLYTKKGGAFGDTPVVVLINQGSASASEIFAGALRDHRDDVVLVGEKSFGKGSVQELIALQGDTAAKITVAKWLTPNKVQIDGEGITPDVEVPYTQEDYEADRDPQKAEAIKIIAERIGVSE